MVHQEEAGSFDLLRGYEPGKAYDKYSVQVAERDIIKDRKNRLLVSQQKTLQDRLQKATPHPYNPGDFVFRKNMYLKQGTNRKTRSKYADQCLIVSVV